MGALRFLPVLLIAGSTQIRGADAPKARPVESLVHGSAPAFVDELIFDSRFEDHSEKIVITSGPNQIRFDETDDGYSFLYNPAIQFYTGLEHRNYTYWQFSWPEVQAAVRNSKRAEKRMQDLANQGLSSDSPPPAASAPAPAAPDTSSLGVGDNSGYVWRPGTEHKRIAGYDCIRWTGETLSGENCMAWCYGTPLPKVTQAIADLRAVDEPMALVPVRTVVPDFIFVVYDALLKSGVTPLMITWGSGPEKGTFRLANIQTLPYDAKLFSVPKLYIKTTLITMDGMIDSQPAPGLRGNLNPPRVDHLAPSTPRVPGQL